MEKEQIEEMMNGCCERESVGDRLLRRIDIGKAILEFIDEEPRCAWEFASLCECSCGSFDLEMISSVLMALTEHEEIECFSYYGKYWYCAKGTDVSKFF